MSLSSAQKQLLFQNCDPTRTLDPSDPRVADIDRDFAEVRGQPWVQKLATKIYLARTKSQLLFFSGLPGSGKSTELKRLGAKLASGADSQPKYLAVLIDALETLDLTSTVDVAEILAVILAMTERKVLSAEGKAPDDALREGAVGRLWHYLNTTEITLSKVEVGIAGSAKTVLELKDNPSLRAQVRKIVAANLTSFLKLVHTELKLLNQRAIVAGYLGGLVVIFDSLEQLQGTSESFHEVLASAEKLFAGGAPYLQLPVHTLYTVPPSVAYRLNLNVDYLPMIMIEARDGEPNELGMNAVRALIEKSIDESSMFELFGAGWKRCRDEIIRASGGYPRDLLRILQDVILEPKFPLATERLAKLITKAGESYRRVALMSGALELMGRIEFEHRLRIENDAEMEQVMRLLRGNLVLRYMNDTDWVSLHPALRTIPEIGIYKAKAEKALAREKAELESA